MLRILMASISAYYNHCVNTRLFSLHCYFYLTYHQRQNFAITSLLVLCIGIALTGFFPSIIGLYATTILMSIGFHYYETVNQSLSLQWFSKAEAPQKLSQLSALKSLATLSALGFIWIAFSIFDADYLTIYLLTGGIGAIACSYLYFAIQACPKQ